MAKPLLLFFVWGSSFATLSFGSSSTEPPSARETYCPVFHPASQPPTSCIEDAPTAFLSGAPAASAAGRDFRVLDEVFDSLETLQNRYFRPELGTWPRAIDWTAAVLETVVAGTLTTLSQTLGMIDLGGDIGWQAKENLLNSLFSQVVGSYFGQDAVAIRNEVWRTDRSNGRQS